MDQPSAKSKGFDKEVEERLPYWVRELLKMIGEVEEGKKARISYMVKRYLSEGKSTKEIAKILYGDETEVGQRKVRALVSKLRKSTNSNNSKSGTSSSSMKEVMPKQGCGGVVRHRNPLINRDSFVDRNFRSQPSHSVESQPSEVVRAPVAGLGSRVGFVLERDVITSVLCDVDAALAIRRLAHRVTGAGFFLYYHGCVTFQCKGDVIAVTEPNGDLEKASQALAEALSLAGLSQMQIERAVSKLKHPSQIAYDELTVEVSDPEVIEIIRSCEPHIPDRGRGPYVILSPSPLMPGLKMYLVDEKLRIELVAHNEKQAYNAFFLRGELVGDVLPRIKNSPGVFDEWRAQYWHPYSHPIVLNLTMEPTKAYRRTVSSVTFDSLPLELQKALMNLRDKGVLWYNDFRVGASERLKKAYRKDPSKVVKDLENADNSEKEIVYVLLQKTVADYETLLMILKKDRS